MGLCCLFADHRNAARTILNATQIFLLFRCNDRVHGMTRSAFDFYFAFYQYSPKEQFATGYTSIFVIGNHRLSSLSSGSIPLFEREDKFVWLQGFRHAGRRYAQALQIVEKPLVLGYFFRWYRPINSVESRT